MSKITLSIILYVQSFYQKNKIKTDNLLVWNGSYSRNGLHEKNTFSIRIVLLKYSNLHVINRREKHFLIFPLLLQAAQLK